MSLKKCLLTSVSALAGTLMSLSVSAQSIETGQLGAAQAYDAGVIDVGSGGLDAALWQGTSSEIASYLLETIPLTSQNALVQDLIEAVVFSAGVPPQGSEEGSDVRYDQLRLKTVMQLGDKEALDNIASRNPDIARDPAIRADLALAGGDVAGACTIADNITDGRGTPVWAKLRAFCHIERGEGSAAELTTELLQNTGHEDDVFYALMKVLTGAAKDLPDTRNISDPLLRAMVLKAGGTVGAGGAGEANALDESASSRSRLNAVFKQAGTLNDGQIASVFSQIAYGDDNLAGGTNFDYASFDLESAKADPTARGMAQLFQLATASGDVRSSAHAMALVLKRADRDGTFTRFSKLFENNLAIIPASFQAEADLKLFARAAVERGDIGALQGFYNAIEEGPQKARIALVADALGNGFTLGTLGKDIEGRLEGSGAEKRRAVRDTFIATAMGARLSGNAALALEGTGNGVGSAVKAGDILGLASAAKAGSRAETALRAAIIIDKSPLDDRSLAAVIDALSVAGLPQFAGRLAAEDFLSAL